MGNIASVSSKKNLVFEVVDAQIREINERRFGGYFRIDGVERSGWAFSYDGQEYPLWHFWLSGKRKIEGKHPIGFEWTRWAWAVFQNELGYSWSGRLSDEGVPGTWAPEKDAYSSFSDYYNRTFRHPDLMYFEKSAHRVPEALRPFAFPDG